LPAWNCCSDYWNCRVRNEGAERITVVSTQAIVGGEPQKAVGILIDAIHITRGETLFAGEHGESDIFTRNHWQDDRARSVLSVCEHWHQGLRRQKHGWNEDCLQRSGDLHFTCRWRLMKTLCLAVRKMKRSTLINFPSRRVAPHKTGAAAKLTLLP
jgi:hypothetical protein